MTSPHGVTEIAAAVRSGAVRAEDVVRASLARADALNGSLNAFLAVAREEALASARALDQKRSRGAALGAMAGVPIAIKDAICTRGLRSTSASKILGSYAPPYDATVVARLIAADAVIVGKTNMDEFAMGSSSENSAFGPVKNPWDLSRSPGGSSGGSAAAVAAGLVPCALGSDTGGSIRQPASHTGTVGVKPTYGRVSRFGLIAFASSLDHIGPFAADVRGAARVLSVIAGHDPRDATSLDLPATDFEAACDRSVRGVRLGVPAEYFGEGLDPEVGRGVKAALTRLEAAGCTLRPVQLSHTKYAVGAYYVITSAEASSNLSRFDGVRFGVRAAALGRQDLRAMYGATRDAGFGDEVKRRILLGTFVLSSGYYDAYYLKAQKVRTLIRRDFERAFRDVDVICSPTSPTPAFPLGDKVNDPLAMYLNDVYTLPASLAGVPALSVPCALTTSNLPIGLHLVGRPLDEETLFAVAAACEQTSSCRQVRPPVHASPDLV